MEAKYAQFVGLYYYLLDDLKGGRGLRVGKGEEEGDVLVDIVAEDVEDGVEDVRLLGSQPRDARLNDQPNAGELGDRHDLIGEVTLHFKGN